MRFSSGKERDSGFGNDYFGARYYSNAFGRWLSPDWSIDPEALPYADLTDPKALNLYEYLGVNLLDGTDPDGHQSGCFTTSSYSGNVLTVNVYCLTLPLSSAVTIHPPQEDPSWDILPRPWPITATV